MKKVNRKAILFCNGIRERTLKESGGIEKLKTIFDEFCDISPLMKPWEHGRFNDVSSDLGFMVKNTSELVLNLRKRKIDYVLFVGFVGSLHRRKITLILALLGISWGVLEIRKDYLNRFTKLNQSPSLLKSSFIYSLLKAISSLFLCPSNIFSNNPDILRSFSVFSRKNLTLVNYRDYYSSLRKENIPLNRWPDGNDGYFVFLDQALPFHYGENLKKKSSMYYDRSSAAAYVASLCDYFVAIESKSGLKPVVCLHPNSPNEYAQLFNGVANVVQGKTEAYIKNSEFVVTHCSTSTSYAYIFDKNVILLDILNQLPDRVRRALYEKNKIEGFNVEVWGDKSNKRELIVPKAQAELRKDIHKWLVPVPESISLCDEIENKIS